MKPIFLNAAAPRAVVLCAVALIAVSTSAFAYDGEKYASEASITLDEATAIALKARPGKIMDKELEKEEGGSGLRYAFDVKSNGATYEVGVDASTGAVLENAPEGSNPD